MITSITQVLLPVLCSFLMIVFLIKKGKDALWLSVIPRCAGRHLLHVQALHRPAQLHHAAAIVLYLAVIVLWLLTVLYVIKTKWVLVVLFILPFFKHLLMDDLPIFLGKAPMISADMWFKELRMLLTMVALSLCAAAFQKPQLPAAPATEAKAQPVSEGVFDMRAVDIVLVIVTMSGGLALFMFGMNNMSKSLSSLTGGVLDKLLGVVTKNRFTAFLFGTVLTAIVQSSSAVSVLTVGLVNSGIILLQQAVGLLIGGGLGSTATAWLLSLNALDGQSLLMTLIKPSTFAPVLALVGVAITMFAKKPKTLNVAHALVGFSVMMIGMNLMSQGVAPLKELPALQSALVRFSNPIIGFLVACGITMLIQSSDATVGIIQAFALSMGLSFGTAIPLICGAQVGTCVTAMLSSLGASNNGKRTALMNLYYALLKVVPFMVVFYAADAVWHFPFLEQSVGGIGIPLFHSLINLFGALLWIPGGKFIVLLAQKTIPFSEEERLAQENVLTMLDENLLRNPSIALVQTDRAVCKLADTVGKAVQQLLLYDAAQEKQTRILLARIKQYRDQIDSYITKLSANSSDTTQTAFVMLLTNSNMAFGEIGAISETVLNYASKLLEMAAAGVIRDTDRTEVRVLGDSIAEILELTVMGYETKDLRLSGTIQLYREEVMQMSEALKARHYRRMHGEGGRLTSTTIFADICYTQERLIDYCDIVADALIKYNRAVNADALPAPVDLAKAKAQVHGLFKDKYEMLQLAEDGERQLVDLSGASC